MYNTTDFGNICVFGLVMFLLVALIGHAEAWPMVGGLAFLIFVSVMLHK
jgi:hypothetical protein